VNHCDRLVRHFLPNRRRPRCRNDSFLFLKPVDLMIVEVTDLGAQRAPE
jgi:hypothetical protein